MIKDFGLALVACVALWGATPLAGAATAASTAPPTNAAPPLALYGHLPSLEHVVLSPDGARLAFVATTDGRRSLIVVDLASGKVVGGLKLSDTKLRSLGWADGEHLLILYSTTSFPPFGFTGGLREWFMLVSYDVANAEMRPVNLYDPDAQTLNVVREFPDVRVLKGDPTLFVQGVYVTDRTLPGLFRLDLQHWRTRLIARGDYPYTDWAVDADGTVAADLVYRQREQEWVIRALKRGHLRPVASGKAAVDPPYIVGFSDDGAALIVSFPSPDGAIWKPLNLADESWGAPLSSGETFDDPIEDRRTGRIVGGVDGVLAPRQVFFDKTMQQHWDTVTAAYSGERIELVSHSDDFSKFVIRVFGPRHGNEYVLIDWKTVDAIPIGDAYAGLSTIAEVRRIDFKASDGYPLTGFLTLPPGKAAKNLSLIVLPHGGPAASDTGDFDWWAQALASRGYAVFQVDYRGSDTTPKLRDAGFGQWGRKMQTDLSDGVHYLAGRGIVDPRRVCIDGGSYGGYAALAGVTLQSGIYRCAVSVAGISDLRSFLDWTNERQDSSKNWAQRYWDRYLGVSGPDDPELKALSPIDHVDAVTVPVLLIHGRKDTVVPYRQSEAMAKALTRAGKSVRLVTLKDEDHWLSHSATREEMLDATVAFLEANDPSD